MRTCLLLHVCHLYKNGNRHLELLRCCCPVGVVQPPRHPNQETSTLCSENLLVVEQTCSKSGTLVWHGMALIYFESGTSGSSSTVLLIAENPRFLLTARLFCELKKGDTENLGIMKCARLTKHGKSMQLTVTFDRNKPQQTWQGAFSRPLYPPHWWSATPPAVCLQCFQQVVFLQAISDPDQFQSQHHPACSSGSLFNVKPFGTKRTGCPSRKAADNVAVSASWATGNWEFTRIIVSNYQLGLLGDPSGFKVIEMYDDYTVCRFIHWSTMLTSQALSKTAIFQIQMTICNCTQPRRIGMPGVDETTERMWSRRMLPCDAAAASDSCCKCCQVSSCKSLSMYQAPFDRYNYI